MYCRISNKCGIERPEGEYSPIRSHAMRHYFSNKYKKVDGDMKEHFMGHGGNDSKMTYEEYDEDEGLDVYLRGLDDVTILGNVETITTASPSVEKMKVQHEVELKHRDEQNAEILGRLNILETKNQFHNGLDMLIGEKTTRKIDGETITTVIGEDHVAVKHLRKVLRLMEADDSIDVTKLTDDEYDKLMESVED